MRVIELFAGVGGFRVGLERVEGKPFEFVYANQWEPATKSQPAYECYIRRFGEAANHTNIKLVSWQEFLILHLEDWFTFKRKNKVM